MKTLILPFIFVAYIILSGCFSYGNRIRGNGHVTEESREVFDFDRIVIDGILDVILVPGEKPEVWVETDEDLQEYIHVFNNGKSLNISTSEENIKFTKNSVYVTFTSLKEIKHDGVGNIRVGGIINTEDLLISANGVGNTDIEVNCNNLTAKQSGVGSLKLKGKAVNLELKNSGVGSVHAFDLESDFARVNNSGVGSTEVFVNKELSVSASGVGSVKYRGGALIRDIDASGVGNVKRVD